MDVLTKNAELTVTKKKKSPYSLKVILDTIRNGLFFQGLRHALAKAGLDIMPYYWVLEEVSPTSKPKLRTDESFKVEQLTKSDLSEVIETTNSINEKKILESFENGQECIGLLHQGKVAAYMFIEFQNFEIKGRPFHLESNEAYLLNMYTLPDHRGKNLAPYLRYHCYRYLEDRDVDRFYSVSNYFNKSAIRFKKKLNSKHLRLYVHVELFKSFQWNFTLKSYA